MVVCLSAVLHSEVCSINVILALSFSVSMVPFIYGKLLVIQYPRIHNYYAVSKIFTENWSFLYSYSKKKVTLCICVPITWYFSQLPVAALPDFLPHGVTIRAEASWICDCITVNQNVSSIHLSKNYSKNMLFWLLFGFL
jgi:hypothetical protein